MELVFWSKFTISFLDLPIPVAVGYLQTPVPDLGFVPMLCLHKARTMDQIIERSLSA